MKNRKNQTIQEVFDLFVTSRTADGVSETTLRTYHNHFHTISLHLDIQLPITDLTKRDLEAMIVSMKKSGLAHNSVSSYARVFRTFLNWCKQEGHCQVEMPKISDKEVVKETYSDEELMLLLKKPDKDCTFNEYRTWVIINLLLKNGCRAASIRSSGSTSVLHFPHHLAQYQISKQHLYKGNNILIYTYNYTHYLPNNKLHLY